jgi:hypothetical protein
MPKNTVPYDIFIIRLSEAYYAAGAPEKANTLINGMVDQAIEKYQYYSRFKGSKAKGVSTELEENTNILMYAQQVAQFNKQDALLKDIQAKSQKVLGAQMPPMQ